MTKQNITKPKKTNLAHSHLERAHFGSWLTILHIFTSCPVNLSQQIGNSRSNLLKYPIPRSALTTEENIVLQRRPMTAEQQLRVKSEELGQQRTHFQAQLLEKEAKITNLRREKSTTRGTRAETVEGDVTAACRRPRAVTTKRSGSK